MGSQISDGICVDSDIIIDYQRGDQTALHELIYLERVAPLAVSTVVRMELVIGSAKKEMLRRTEKMLHRFHLLPLSAEVGIVADHLITQYNLSQGLRLADALIAATAIHYQLPFITKNQRDFHFIPGLKLLPYPAAPII